MNNLYIDGDILELVSLLKQINQTILTMQLFVMEQMFTIMTHPSLTSCLVHHARRVRAETFALLENCLVTHPFPSNTSLRTILFTRLESHPYIDTATDNDVTDATRLLSCLIQGGYHCEPFERQLGPLLLKWLPPLDALDQAQVMVFDRLFCHILSRSKQGLDTVSVTAIVTHLCERGARAWQKADHVMTRHFVKAAEALVACHYQGSLSSSRALRVLCCLATTDGHRAWRLMRALLTSAYQHIVLHRLLALLNKHTGECEWTLRGGKHKRGCVIGVVWCCDILDGKWTSIYRH